jgi:HAD superfamily hydrolase (TIGR01509 family)
MKQAIQQYLEKHGFEALRPKAVLFDMDGVLYDSMSHHAVAWQKSMATFGIRMTVDDAYATEGARGVDTIRMMVKRQQGRDIDEMEAQRMYDEKTRQFHALPETNVMQGVLDLMAQIHADGLTIGVVTGSGQRPLINRLLKDFGQYLTEDHIVTAYDVKHGKPDPEPYLRAWERSGYPKEQCCVIENAPLGVRAGKAAGLYTIAVNTGPLPDKMLQREGADQVFPDMDALYNWLVAK